MPWKERRFREYLSGFFVRKLCNVYNYLVICVSRNFKNLFQRLSLYEWCVLKMNDNSRQEVMKSPNVYQWIVNYRQFPAHQHELSLLIFRKLRPRQLSVMHSFVSRFQSCEQLLFSPIEIRALSVNVFCICVIVYLQEYGPLFVGISVNMFIK